mgnify:CR=1 FL=1
MMIIVGGYACGFKQFRKRKRERHEKIVWEKIICHKPNDDHECVCVCVCLSACSQQFDLAKMLLLLTFMK